MTRRTFRAVETNINGVAAHNPTPRFQVYEGEELVGMVDAWMETVHWLGLTIQFEKLAEPFKRGPADVVIAWRRAAYEYARVIGAELADGETRRVQVQYEDIAALLKPSVSKQCRHQARRDGDLFCRVPIEPEPIASAIMGAAVQPTSEIICGKECPVPDDRVACRHFTHPRIGLEFSSGFDPAIKIGPALCGAGHDDRLEPHKCTLSGNACWEGEIALPSYAGATAGPTAIHEALEFFGMTWKQKHQQPLFTNLPPSLLGSLALDVRTMEDLRARLLDLFELLKALRVDDALLPPGPKPEPQQTFKRLQLMFPNSPEAEKSVRALQAANDFRNALVHSHARDRGPRLAETLGVEWPVRDPAQTWGRIRGVVAAAIADLRRLVA